MLKTATSKNQIGGGIMYILIMLANNIKLPTIDVDK
jgi:hypothetical protein